MNYYSKTASKSFDELDDILTSEKKAQESTTTTAVVVQPTTASVMMKNSPSSSMMDEASASSAASRHSCDELMMTRSLYEAETSDDAGSQVINIRPQMLSRGLSNHLLYPFGTSIDKRGQNVIKGYHVFMLSLQPQRLSKSRPRANVWSFRPDFTN